LGTIALPGYGWSHGREIFECFPESEADAMAEYMEYRRGCLPENGSQ
jgi:hypothetical protein